MNDEDLNIENIEDFIDLQNVNKLSESNKLLLDEDISTDEILSALKQTSNSSSPGITGLTYSFYKVFWSDLKYIITNCFK